MASFTAFSGVLPTTAAPTRIATAVAAKTLLKLITPANISMKVWKWEISFDGTGTTPVLCELHIRTESAAGTGSASPSILNVGPIDSALTTGVTGTNGFNYTVEPTVTAVTRMGDFQQVLPGNYFQNEWSLGREFYVPPSSILAVRVTAGVTTLNAFCSISWDE